MNNNNIAQSLANEFRKMHETEPYELHDGPAATFMVVPEGKKLVSVEPFFSERAATPRRQQGTYKVRDAISFLRMVERFRERERAVVAESDVAPNTLLATTEKHYADALIICDAELTAPDVHVAAIFNAPLQGEPGFADFAVHLTPPVSEAWKVWTTAAKQPLSVRDFANLIEDRVSDIAVPSTDPRSALNRIVTLMTVGNDAPVVGTPASLMVTSRRLSIRVEEQVSEAITLASGEVQISYGATHGNQQGGTLQIPSLFAVNIPVFEGGVVYEVPVRLRYEIDPNTKRVKWSVKLVRPDIVVRDAVNELVSYIAADTALNVHMGALPGSLPEDND